MEEHKTINMRLTHFSYKEANSVFEPLLPLQEVSLLFNRNTVGNLKAMGAVDLTICYILQTVTLDNKRRFALSLTFEDEGEQLTYRFNVSEGEITVEINKVILYIHRVAEQNPYIEKLMSWAKLAHSLSFKKTDTEFTRTSISSAYHRNILFIMMKSLSEASLNKVINQADQLGYHISSTETINHDELHAIYLLTYMEYISSRKKPSLLLLDNFCEGLDYDRSIQLGRLLFSFCLKHNIQLIVSSNNTFFINMLKLKYWNILLRKESEM